MLVVESSIFPKMVSWKVGKVMQIKVELLTVRQKTSVFFQLSGLY